MSVFFNLFSFQTKLWCGTSGYHLVLRLGRERNAFLICRAQQKTLELHLNIANPLEHNFLLHAKSHQHFLRTARIAKPLFPHAQPIRSVAIPGQNQSLISSPPNQEMLSKFLLLTQRQDLLQLREPPPRFTRLQVMFDHSTKICVDFSLTQTPCDPCQR